MKQGRCRHCGSSWTWPTATSKHVYCPGCGRRLGRTRNASGAIALPAAPTGPAWAELHRELEAVG